MCQVCIATGRMTGAEWDQIQAAERDQNLAALLDICGKIEAREDAKRSVQIEPTTEDKREDETLDRVLASLIDMAKEHDGLPLKQAHGRLARELMDEVGMEELAYGLAALATRIWRNAR